MALSRKNTAVDLTIVLMNVSGISELFIYSFIIHYFAKLMPMNYLFHSNETNVYLIQQYSIVESICTCPEELLLEQLAKV